MKTISLVLVVLALLPVRANGECVDVPTVYHPSGQNPQLSVRLQGKPYPAAKLGIYSIEGKLQRLISSDSVGVIKLPDLQAGRYCLIAAGAPHLRSDLCLELSSIHHRSPEVFSMDLGYEHGAWASAWSADYVFFQRAGERQPTERLQRFKGVVRDPSGSVFPHTRVLLSRRGAQLGTRPLEIATDSEGHFAADLERGTYTAIFDAQAFVPALIEFEIDPKGSVADLNVVLKLGGC